MTWSNDAEKQSQKLNDYIMHIMERYVHGRTADCTNREFITLIQMASRGVQFHLLQRRLCCISGRCMAAQQLHVKEAFMGLLLYTKHQDPRGTRQRRPKATEACIPGGKKGSKEAKKYKHIQMHRRKRLWNEWMCSKTFRGAPHNTGPLEWVTF